MDRLSLPVVKSATAYARLPASPSPSPQPELAQRLRRPRAPQSSRRALPLSVLGVKYAVLARACPPGTSLLAAPAFIVAFFSPSNNVSTNFSVVCAPLIPARTLCSPHLPHRIPQTQQRRRSARRQFNHTSRNNSAGSSPPVSAHPTSQTPKIRTYL